MCRLREKARIGNAGEVLVKNTIDQIIDELGYDKRVYSNCYFQFPSVYGQMSTEMDIVVFSPDRIFVFEIKNCKFGIFDYDEPTWTLFNKKAGKEEETSNPLTQNRNHKMILCEKLGIPPENVCTIEVLLVNGKDYSRESAYPNDYVLDKEQLFTDLRFLLVSNKIAPAIDQAYTRFKEIVKSGREYRNIHIKNLKRRNAIKEQMKEDQLTIFKHNDMVRCPICQNGFLSFEKCSWKLIQQDCRSSKQLYLKCNSCGKTLRYSRSYDLKTIQGLKTVGIRERNQWQQEETHMKTVYDDVMILRARIKELEKKLKESEKQILSLKMELNESHAENQRLSGENADLKVEVEKGKLPSTCLKRWLVYLLRQTKKLCVFLVKLVIKIFRSLWKKIITSITP
ncbi:MAG: NERD domain-containing protein [Clostridiales bacterium]|nr:NERD domain-containing protein [Clostridiales bacterium]